MSDQVQILITNVGILLIACLPIIGLYFKKIGENQEELKKHITAIVAAIALLASSMFAVWNARNHAATEQANKIEAVKALSGVSSEHKEERARFLGIAPPKP